MFCVTKLQIYLGHFLDFQTQSRKKEETCPIIFALGHARNPKKKLFQTLI